MKLPVRYFAIGLLTASLIIVITAYFFDHPSSNIENESIEDVIAHIENEGYRVITEDEYISLSVNTQNDSESNEDHDHSSNDNQDKDDNNNNDDEENNDNNDNNDNDDEENDNDDNENNDDNDDEEKVYKYTIKIEENMFASEIGKLLKENKIIDDASDFVDFLEDNDYSQNIQLGKHKVTSEMDFKELAEKLTD